MVPARNKRGRVTTAGWPKECMDALMAEIEAGKDLALISKEHSAICRKHPISPMHLLVLTSRCAHRAVAKEIRVDVAEKLQDARHFSAMDLAPTLQRIKDPYRRFKAESEVLHGTGDLGKQDQAGGGDKYFLLVPKEWRERYGMLQLPEGDAIEIPAGSFEEEKNAG